MPKYKTILAALCALATLMVKADIPGPPLPVLAVDLVNGATGYQLKLDDYRNIVGYKVYAKTNLTDEAWVLLSTEVTGNLRAGMTTEFEFSSLSPTVAMSSPYKFFKLHAVTGPSGCNNCCVECECKCGCNCCSLVYAFELDKSGTVTLAEATYGYGSQTANKVDALISNTGNQSGTFGVSASPSGLFVLSITSVGLSAGSSSTLTVHPVTGLNAGTHTATITVAGSPADFDPPQSFDVSFMVNKATPVVIWPTGLTAFDDETLGDVALPANGSGVPAGVFTWTSGNSTAVGTAGTRAHNMTFTPNDAANYETVNSNVDVVVSAAPFVNNWNGVEHTIRIDLGDDCKVDILPANYDVLNPTDNGTDGDLAKTRYLYFRYIRAGKFPIGTIRSNPDELDFAGTRANEAPAQRTMAGFYIGVFPLTEAQFNRITTNGVYTSNLPKTSISYNAIYSNQNTPEVFPGAVPTADSVLGILRNMVKNGKSKIDIPFDIPSESQWEFACRAGERGTYNDGKGAIALQTTAEANLLLLGWFTLNNNPATAGNVENFAVGRKPVGYRAKNDAGLYDMHGNVREFCRDTYVATYPSTSDTDFVHGKGVTGSNRVTRGGNYGNVAINCRSAYRNDTCSPSYGDGSFGFRLATQAVAPIQ